MTEYVDSISDKKRAAEEIADTLINRVEKKFASKKGKIEFQNTGGSEFLYDLLCFSYNFGD